MNRSMTPQSGHACSEQGDQGEHHAQGLWELGTAVHIYLSLHGYHCSLCLSLGPSNARLAQVPRTLRESRPGIDVDLGEGCLGTWG